MVKETRRARLASQGWGSEASQGRVERAVRGGRGWRGRRRRSGLAGGGRLVLGSRGADVGGIPVVGVAVPSGPAADRLARDRSRVARTGEGESHGEPDVELRGVGGGGG